jgi:hypothetical protein
MLSREIFVNALAFTKRPILEIARTLRKLQVAPTAFQQFPRAVAEDGINHHPPKKI